MYIRYSQRLYWDVIWEWHKYDTYVRTYIYHQTFLLLSVASTVLLVMTTISCFKSLFSILSCFLPYPGHYFFVLLVFVTTLFAVTVFIHPMLWSWLLLYCSLQIECCHVISLMLAIRTTLFTLAKQSRQLGAYKLARFAYEKLQVRHVYYHK